MVGFSNNLKKYFYTFYTFFEYSIFAFVFWINIQNPKIKRLIIILSSLFLIYLIVYVSTTEIVRLDSVPIGIETILVFVYIITFLYESSRTIKDNYIYNHYCFWISVGILIYLGGSFFFYILIDHLDTEQVASFGNLTYIAEIIKNILFSVAILVYSRKSNEKVNKPPSVPYLDII